LPSWSLFQIKTAHLQAGVSTASMGKFDKRLKGEKEGERKPVGKRRKFMAVTDTKTEREKLSGFADKFLRERYNESGHFNTFEMHDSSC
jgi:regulator of ribosome biosynthesis